MMTNSTLNARELQAAIAFVLMRAETQHAAEKGAMAAAVSIAIATRGPASCIDYLRDLADLIEQDELLPKRGETMQ